MSEDVESLKKTVRELLAKLQEAEQRHQSDRVAFEVRCGIWREGALRTGSWMKCQRLSVWTSFLWGDGSQQCSALKPCSPPVCLCFPWMFVKVFAVHIWPQFSQAFSCSFPAVLRPMPSFCLLGNALSRGYMASPRRLALDSLFY